MSIHESEPQKRGQEESGDISSLINCTEKLSLFCSLSSHQSRAEPFLAQISEISEKRKGKVKENQNEEEVENAIAIHDSEENELNNGLVERFDTIDPSQEKIEKDEKDDSDEDWVLISTPPKAEATEGRKDEKDIQTDKSAGTHDEGNEESNDLVEKGHLNNFGQGAVAEKVTSDDKEEEDERAEEEGEDSDDENEPDELEPGREGEKLTDRITTLSLCPPDAKSKESEGKQEENKAKEKNKLKVTQEEDHSDDENQQDDEEAAKGDKGQPRLLPRGLAGLSQPQHYAEQTYFTLPAWQNNNVDQFAPPPSYAGHNFGYAPNEVQPHQLQYFPQQNAFPWAQWQEAHGEPIDMPPNHAVPNFGYVWSSEAAQPANYPEQSCMQGSATEAYLYDQDECRSSSLRTPEENQSVLPELSDIDHVLEVMGKVENSESEVQVTGMMLKYIQDYLKNPFGDNPTLEQDEQERKSQILEWKRNLNYEKLFQCHKIVGKKKDEELIEADEDGDTPLMIVASSKDTKDYEEELVAMVERQKDIPLCCNKLISEAGLCNTCGNADKYTFHSPLSIRSKEWESVLTCVIKMQRSRLVVSYIIEKIRLREIDVQRLTDQCSLGFYKQHVDQYPELLVLLKH